MMKLFDRLFPKKKSISLEEENKKAIQENYQKALQEYNEAVERYELLACDENEEYLFNAMLNARNNLDNMIRLVRLNSNNRQIIKKHKGRVG